MKPQKLYINAFLILLGIFAVFTFNAQGQNSGTKAGDMAIIVKDSVPLRSQPNASSPIDKYVYAGLQLKINKISEDEKWYKIKIGESKGYEISRDKEYWVFHNNVYTESSTAHSNIFLDLSVYEKENLKNSRIINHKDYLNHYTQLDLKKNYYIGSIYFNRSPRLSCSKPFSVCAQIYKPGKYFLYAMDVKRTDAKSKEELENRYKTLYENGTFTPFYRIKSDLEIKSVHEMFICTKQIMDQPGCHLERENYVGTELESLNDTTYIVNDKRFLSAFPLNTDFFFKTNLNGGVQGLRLLYILEIEYANNQKEKKVRRLKVWWPLCL